MFTYSGSLTPAGSLYMYPLALSESLKMIFDFYMCV